ncbi:hypothetical protein D3C72_1793440 [compost metagenome]
MDLLKGFAHIAIKGAGLQKSRALLIANEISGFSVERSLQTSSKICSAKLIVAKFLPSVQLKVTWGPAAKVRDENIMTAAVRVPVKAA